MTVHALIDAVGLDVDRSYMRRAACGGKWDIMIPEKGELAGAAKRVCAECPVIQQCREFALDNPIYAIAGVWGGLTYAERKTIRRNRR